MSCTWSDDYEAMLRADARASAFWDAATPSYRKVATNWVLTAKQEATRDKRMAELVDDCANLRLIRIAALRHRAGLGATDAGRARLSRRRGAALDRVSACPWAG